MNVVHPTEVICLCAWLPIGCRLVVLQQKVDDQWCPFSSKRLIPPTTRYSAINRELLAIYLAIKHFQHFVEVRQFDIVTDHKPLTFTLKFNHNHKPRHLDLISQFTNDIVMSKALKIVLPMHYQELRLVQITALLLALLP